MTREPDWLIQYGDIINKLRITLCKFENSNTDFQSFINEINKSLINCGYDPVKVVVSDFMANFFEAYAVYMPRRPMPIIYVATELMRKPKPLLGRVLMHEVFHHVLYQRPPSLLFRLVPRRVEPLILMVVPLITITILAILYNISTSSMDFLPYIITALLLSTSLMAAVLIRALGEHELVATALVIYLITGRWVKDWAYYRNEDALMSIRWGELTESKEVVLV